MDEVHLDLDEDVVRVEWSRWGRSRCSSGWVGCFPCEAIVAGSQVEEEAWEPKWLGTVANSSHPH